jgi:RNA polymerase sigma factor (sigma-70 family)
MSDGRLSGVLRHLSDAALLRDGAPSDGWLLERYLGNRDEPAFEALVRRHGPMVLGVCRRVLGDCHEAEDAFQATFLALVRKAASIGSRELVGNWLYGVAYRTALYSRRTASRRRAVEKQVGQMPERKVVEPEPLPDLRPLLDRELSRLPEVYRIPMVLCDLGGKTRQEVARQLGVPEGTVSSRLARGRELLRKRLTRQGMALTGAALVLGLTEAASAAVPPALLRSTVRAGVSVAAGRAAAAVSAPVAFLLRAVLREMVVAKFKAAAVLLLAASLVVLAAGLIVRQALPQNSPSDTLAAAPAPLPVEDHWPSFVQVAGSELDRTLSLHDFVNLNGTLYFVATNAADNGQLWRCNPTANGMRPTPITSIPPNHRYAGSAPRYLTNVNGTLFFVSRDSARGLELWKSDGTPKGTVPIKDINPGGEINPPRKPGGMMYLGLFAAGKTLFFVCTDGDRDLALQKSDGTAAGTGVVKNINAAPAVGFSARRATADVNGTLFFMGFDAAHGQELWKSDGTAAGTKLVKDIGAGPFNSNPSFLTNVNGTLVAVHRMK